MSYENFLKVAIEAARKAGARQLKSLGRVKKLEFKGDINLVTEVDKECEEIIVQIISKNFSDHDILAEEGHEKSTQSDYRWVIDPLDGTTNYSHAYPLFCASIALEFQGEIIVGVVYDPNRDELFRASLGQGAYLNDQPIYVSKIDQIKRAMLTTGFAYNVQQVENNNLDHFADFLMQAQAVRRDGVAATDLCYVACGRYDGYWELNLFPWDVAAGIIVLTEAGGIVSKFDGSSVSIDDKEILASNNLLHKQMIEILTHAKT